MKRHETVIAAPLAWASKVIDAIGDMQLRLHVHGQDSTVVGSRVETRGTSMFIAERLRTLLGGHVCFKPTRWVCPASMQEEVLTKLLPHLVALADVAMAIIKYRALTGNGWAPGVRELKQSIVQDLTAPGTDATVEAPAHG